MNAYLTDYAILTAIVRPAIVIAVLAGLWVALKRGRASSRSRVSTWLAVAIPLVAWFALIWTAAAAGVFEAGRSQLPLIPLALILPLVIGLTLLMRSSRIAVAIDAASPSWLVGLQVYRVLGASFLHYGPTMPFPACLRSRRESAMCSSVSWPYPSHFISRPVQRMGERSQWRGISSASSILSMPSPWVSSVRLGRFSDWRWIIPIY